MLPTEQALQLALQHHQAGRLQQAEELYRQILARQPNHADALHLLGVIAHQAGRNNIAVDLIRQALTLRPNWPEACVDLGVALKDKGQVDEAIASYRQAISFKPVYPQALSNLGNALKDKGQLDEAIACYRQAIAFNPNLAAAHYNLGVALRDNGQLDEAITSYRQAISLQPHWPRARSNLVFTMHYCPACDAQAIAGEQRHWDRLHAEPLRGEHRAHANDRDPDRRLRIGYVSPDFRDHCQALFMVPLLSAHDHRAVEIFCYSDVACPDDLTRQLRGHADVWRNILGQSDEQAASVIRQDGIDILVDLTMHMDRNRLLVFARKPAPVQVCWLAYPGSTGLTAIDYRLSDPYLDPPGMDESVYSEQTIRLPDSFWCYDSLDCRDIPVNSLPAVGAPEQIRGTGVPTVSSAESHSPDACATTTVTFGCLNNVCKVNDPVLRLWAQVLRQVQGSRLMLLAGVGSHRRRTLDLFQTQGIHSDRVDFVPRQPRRQYLELYRRIDLGLDTFPYNGHTTSLDSLWMGVPVVTLVGQTAVSRAGWCQLSNLGLTELAGQTPEQFVRIAVGLAGDLPRLGNLRAELRTRMEQSPLMDAPRFARNIETAYRRMWRTWCATPSADD